MTTPMFTRCIRKRFSVLYLITGLVAGLFATSAALPLPANAATVHKAPKFLVKYETEPTYGLILTSNAGFPLYVYAGDTKNASTVTGAKLTAWPPLVLPPGDVLTLARRLHKALGKFTLPTGQVQVTWHGLPLYTFTKDTMPDVVTGEGKGAIFRVVQVAFKK